jgi:hypothetical protein
MHFDAGHLGQTFALVASANGLGPGQTIAFRDTELERLLDIDRISEVALYCLSMGIPAIAPVKDVARPPALAEFARSTLFEDF